MKRARNCGISTADPDRPTPHDRFMQQSMGRAVAVVYAGIAYAAFVVASLWAVGFLADAGAPTVVDGPARRPAWSAALIDAGLLLIFAAQHTVMARAGVKRRLVR